MSQKRFHEVDQLNTFRSNNNYAIFFFVILRFSIHSIIVRSLELILLLFCWLAVDVKSLVVLLNLPFQLPSRRKTHQVPIKCPASTLTYTLHFFLHRLFSYWRFLRRKSEKGFFNITEIEGIISSAWKIHLCMISMTFRLVWVSKNMQENMKRKF